LSLHEEGEHPDESLSSQEDEDEASGDYSDDSLDTAAEIELAQQPSKSKQTLKRKRRAVPPSSFGKALTALLETSTSKSSVKPASDEPESLSTLAPETAVLALKKTSFAKKRRAEEKIEAKAAKAQLGERKEREERNRISDVIGGWGGESERALRKVAQRGVVKLFNVIQQAQQSSSQATTNASAGRGSGKATLPAPSADAFRDNSKGKGKGKKDNAVGRAKPAALDQQDFLASIRSGAIVSKV